MVKSARKVTITESAAFPGTDAPRSDSGSWWSDSPCRQYPTQWWFAGGQRDTLLAKDICSRCDVRTSCLEFALGRPELLGVWAATTPNERAAMRRVARGGPVVVDNELDTDPDTGEDDPATAPKTGEDDRDADRDVRRDLERVLPAERAPLALAPDLASEPALAPESEVAPEPDTAPARAPRRGGGPGDRPELLTPAEAARMLGVTPNTVTRWSRAGKVSAIQTMGGHRRFRRSEVERVLREANLGG